MADHPANDEPLAVGLRTLEAGKPERALEDLSIAFSTGTDALMRSRAASAAALACLRLGRLHEATGWCEDLRDVAPDVSDADVIDAAVAIASGDAARAWQLLERAGTSRGGSAYLPATMDATLRTLAALKLGRLDAAFHHAGLALAEDRDLSEVWKAVAVIAAASPDLDLATVLDPVDDATLNVVLGHLTGVATAGTYRLLEGLWQRWPADERILTTATLVAHRFSLERALEWSSRLRQAGMSEHCALLGRATRDDVAPAERVRAAAVAHRAFEDPRASVVLETATREVPDEELAPLFADLVALEIGELLGSFVVAAASTPPRCVLLGASLVDYGSDDAAIDLLRHAATMSQESSYRWDDPSVADLLGSDQRARLRTLLEARGETHLLPTAPPVDPGSG